MSDLTVNDSPLSALRQGIVDCHQRLENQPMFAGLLATPPVEADYREVLQVLNAFYAEIEPALLPWPCPQTLPAYLPRLPWLLADLQSLGLVVSATLEPLPLANLAEYLGRRYVIEGSALGAKTIVKHWQQHDAGSVASHHFFSQQAATSLHWPAFQKALTQHLTTPAEIETAIVQARLCFERLILHATRFSRAHQPGN